MPPLPPAALLLGSLLQVYAVLDAKPLLVFRHWRGRIPRPLRLGLSDDLLLPPLLDHLTALKELERG